MKITESKKQHFYDNPKTMRRELYRRGGLVSSWDQRTLEKIRQEDRTVRPWGTYDIPPTVDKGAQDAN